jgi:hypothetical protein
MAFLNFMKKLALFIPLFFLLSGCTTTKTYTPNLTAGPAKPPNYPIPLYTEDQRVPRPCELIGTLSIGDTEFTVSGGSVKGVMKTLMDTAHEKGADVVQITSMLRPDFKSANYRVEANLLRYSDAWETVAVSENDFLAYLRQHQRTLDSIEGIWSDGSADRIGIIRNNSKPGRDFIGFALDASLPSWQKGYKKMDIARAKRPGAYAIKYYKDDFAMQTTTIVLDHSRAFNFFVQDGDEGYDMTFTKISAPMPVNY